MWALVAFGLWGFFPLYYRELAALSPFAVLIHRIVWSAVFLVLVLSWRRQWAWIVPWLARLRGLRPTPECQPVPWKLWGTFLVTALLVSSNWLIYVVAVHNHQIVEASLGYFMNPLINVALGVILLKERLNRWQWLAIGLAAVGVAWLTWQTGRAPWIALSLGCTFAAYGLLRKVGVLGPLEGLTLETLILAPAALSVLIWATFQAAPAEGAWWWPHSGWTWFLVLMSGPVTAAPLLAFAAAARRLPLATLGLFQYLTPSVQLLQGVWLFDEPFDADRGVGFGFIWFGLLVVSAHALWQYRRSRPAQRRL